MELEALEKAMHDVNFLVEDLRELHSSADGCEIIVVEKLLEKAVEISTVLRRLDNFLEHERDAK